MLFISRLNYCHWTSYLMQRYTTANQDNVIQFNAARYFPTFTAKLIHKLSIKGQMRAAAVITTTTTTTVKCWLLIRRSRRASVSCLWALCLGPDAEPVQGRTGDPAPPAPLSSRVSLIQCSNFSIILNNYCTAATFACRPHLSPLHIAGPLHRSANRVILPRIPKHTPLIQEYSNINSYLAGIKIGYAITSMPEQQRFINDVHWLQWMRSYGRSTTC